MIFHDENDVEWECIEVRGGSGAAVGERDGTIFRRLRCRRADNPASAAREIIVSAELDLNDPVIQRCVLRWAAKHV
jgi:hypothetical protein